MVCFNIDTVTDRHFLFRLWRMVLRFLGRVVLLLLALGLGALSLGAFASMNYGAPLWLRTLSVTEGVLSASAPQIPVFVRALLEATVAAGLVYWAAYWPLLSPPNKLKTPTKGGFK